MKETLAKPEPNEAGQFAYTELIQYLEGKYDFDAEGSADCTSHFEKWADAQGYTERKRDSEGKHRRSSNIWYEEYQSDPAGAASRPPVKSFRRWLYCLGNAFLGVEAPAHPVPLNMGLLLDSWDETVAPVAQQILDMTRNRATSRIESALASEAVPVEYRARLLRDALEMLPVSARIPAYARPILEHIRDEFGEQVVVTF